jgi:hypothetical protein
MADFPHTEEQRETAFREIVQRPDYPLEHILFGMCDQCRREALNDYGRVVDPTRAERAAYDEQERRRHIPHWITPPTVSITR